MANETYAFAVEGVDGAGGAGERIVVCLNLTDDPAAFANLDVTEIAATGPDGTRVDGSVVTVPAHGWAVLK